MSDALNANWAPFSRTRDPRGQLAGSVTSNVEEVFKYFTQRKGKIELPLK